MGIVQNAGVVGEGTLPVSDQHAKALNYAEQVCMSRCSAKWMQGKSIIDDKLKGAVQNPLTFAQNLP